MRKKKIEKLVNEIKKEIGFVDNERYYTIKPRYLRELFEKISKSVKWKNGISKEIYVLVNPNGQMEQFKVVTYEDIENIIEYANHYNIENIELDFDKYWNDISIYFEDNGYNRYNIHFEPNYKYKRI